MINVTKSSMPEYTEYCNCIKELWENRHLTNYGIYHNKFQKKLESLFGINNVIPIVNGTIALLLGLSAMDFPKESEIITTPFSFVATSSSIVWQNYKPVFVDIESDTFNIDYKKIENSINQNTKAILAVHAFGNPCNTEKLREIANKYHLKLIYDAAHSFGVNYKGKSLLHYGDISILSFHATKVFHTIEGGAICTRNDELGYKIKKKMNFGQGEDNNIEDIGINGKMNEFQAIMGLLNLDKIEEDINKRKAIYFHYIEGLKSLNTEFQLLNCSYKDYNFCYFPILFKNNIIRDEVYETLYENGIVPRKYFYPLINDMEPYKIYHNNDTPIAKNISDRILTLPLYSDLTIEESDKVIELIKQTIN